MSAVVLTQFTSVSVLSSPYPDTVSEPQFFVTMGPKRFKVELIILTSGILVYTMPVVLLSPEIPLAPKREPPFEFF